MTKRSYTVGEKCEDEPPNTEDKSYRSFICTLLIFLVICLIILLASMSWSGGPKGEDQQKHNFLNQKGRQTSYSTTTSTFAHTTPGPTPVLTQTTENYQEKSATKIYNSTTTISTTDKIYNSTLPSTTVYKTNSSTSTPTNKINNNFISSTTEAFEVDTAASQGSSNKIVKITSSETTDNLTDEINFITTNKLESTTKATTSDVNLSQTPAEELTTENIERLAVSGIVKEDTTPVESVENTVFTFSSQTSFIATVEENRNSPTETSNAMPFTLKLEASDNFSSEVDSASTGSWTTFTNLQPITINSTSPQATILTKPTTKQSTFAVLKDLKTSSTEASNAGMLTSNVEVSENVISETDVESTISLSTLTTTSSPEPVMKQSTVALIKNYVLSSSTVAPQTTKHQVATSTAFEISPVEQDIITENRILQQITKVPQKVKTCNNAACTSAASQILSLMNHEAKPCDDFYDFACGGVYQIEDKSTNELEAYLNALDASKKYLNDFKTFYGSCLEYETHFNYRERIKGVESLVKDVGKFSLDEDANHVDLTTLVANLILRQSMPLFDVGVDVDKQSSNFILQLTLPKQSFLRNGLQEWSALEWHKDRCLHMQNAEFLAPFVNLTDVYQRFVNCQKNYSNYLDSIENVITEFEIFSTLSPEKLRKEIKEIRMNIEFEVLNKLDELPSSAEILSECTEKNYEMRRLSDLQLHFPIFEWQRMFQIVTGREVPGGTILQVYFGPYFKILFKSLSKIDKKILNDAFLAIYANDLFINTVIPKEMTNRNKFCLDISKTLLPDVWSFISSTSNSNNKNQQKTVTELFNVLKKNFCWSLLGAEWIDDFAKTSIVSKCNGLQLEFFQPVDETSLATYQGIKITNNYQTNLLTLLTQFKRQVYSAMDSPMSAKTLFSYFLDPLSKKPFSCYSNKMIIVPLGLINEAKQTLPGYVIMAKIGLDLARQIARHFDPIGIKYRVQLSDDSRSKYTSFEQTVPEMIISSNLRTYNNRNVSFVINGSLSATERVVDNTAFRLILDSFESFGRTDNLPFITPTYSKEKAVYIAAIQNFCKKTSLSDFMMQVSEQKYLPPALRVENAIGNSETFFETFLCPSNSKMDRFTVKKQFPFLIPFRLL